MKTEFGEIDILVNEAVFGENPKETHREIREQAARAGVFPESLQGLYEAAGRGLYHGITVPAINIRGITYHVARAVFRAALKNRVGPFIFEIARSEIGYTLQKPAEYAACILAAAVKEGFRGPVFIQGDHFQVSRSLYAANAEKEFGTIRALIQEAVDAGFYNIDIDASTLVDLTQPSLEAQQARNCQVTADMTRFVRAIQPAGTVISVGGEIGEVGGRNSTVDDLRAFMAGYLKLLASGAPGISKISVQTGTTHGGVVLPDGSIARVQLDFKTLEELSRVARQEYRLAGAVQHGASTLPDEAFRLFPEAGAAEVHLATGFQNIIYDSPHFPGDLKETIYRFLLQAHAAERKPGETDEQLIYRNRKRAFGRFKKEMWRMPEDSLRLIAAELEDRFSLIFRELKVTDTVDLVARFVR
ncbi:MAG: class II fructose-bisphosphate aldolase [Chloroflexi bacterium]|nr:class II fructose-bisphosphate aldolase [Chloroflexota bacterium]